MTRSGPLSRKVIVDAALAHADRGELESLTARGLAAELGVTPMALYRHFANLDEILSGVVDVLLGRIGVPPRTGDGWRSWLEDLAQSLRQLFVEQPVAVAAFAREPVTTPAARARLKATVDVLVDAGFDRNEAIRAYAAVHTYTVGFCALEAARASGRRHAPDPSTTPTPTPDPDGDGDRGDEARLIGAFVNQDQFEHGLRALLRGLTPDDPDGRSARRRR